MKAIALLSLLVAASPALSAEEAVVLTAGEHQGFSRIAVTGGLSSDYIELIGRKILIKNIAPSQAIQLRDVNDFRKAYRVTAAKEQRTSEGKAVELSLNCDCDIRTQTLSNGKVIIDIFDPKKTADASSQEKKATTNRVSDKDLLSVEKAHDRMLTLLKQAAREGLITVKDPDADQAEMAMQDDDNITNKPTILEEPPIKVASTEQDAPPAPEQKKVLSPTPAATKTRRLCFDDQAFSINDQQFQAEPLVEITHLHGELADNEGAAAQSIRHKLVSGYLSIGFGEEALAILVKNKSGKSLRADMARVIAERSIAPDGALLGADNCQGAHALWQAFASDGPEAVSLFHASGSAITTLPRRLKALLVPRLAITMINARAWREAEDLYSLATENIEHETDELKYIRARLDENKGELKSSRDALRNIASQNTNAGGEAVLALAESYAVNGDTPYEGLTEDIGALARVDNSSRSAFAEATVWASVGNVEAALLLLKNTAGKSEKDRLLSRKLAIDFYTDALSEGKEHLTTAIVSSYIENKDWLRLTPKDGVQRQIAQAAEAIGLPNVALAIFDGAPLGADPDLAFQRAQTALAADEVEKAIMIAAPHASEDRFSKLIVDANIQRGEYHAALAATSAIKEKSFKTAIAAKAAWLARSWENASENFHALDPNLLTTETALHYALSSYITKENNIPPAADAILSKENPTFASGVRSLFLNVADGTALERGNLNVEHARQEIEFFREILNDG